MELAPTTKLSWRTQFTLKAMREELDIITAYHELGSYRVAAKLCGTTHRTVKRLVGQRGELPRDAGPALCHANTDAVLSVIWGKVRTTDGRLTAERLAAACPRTRRATPGRRGSPCRPCGSGAGVGNFGECSVKSIRTP